MDIFTYVQYVPPGWVGLDFDHLAEQLPKSLRWEVRDKNRSEAFISRRNSPYYYGGRRGHEVRPYFPQREPYCLTLMWAAVQWHMRRDFEACFINHYENDKGGLGWHADDSPSIDQGKPVVILTLGQTRTLLFRPYGDEDNITKFRPEHGSLTVMHPGTQERFQHTVEPEDGPLGSRFSLVFRGLHAYKG